MDNEANVMRQQMDKTLAGLTDKLGKLEHQVLGTVRTINNSVNTVRDTFDLKLHVRQRPWTFLAGATALGFLITFRSNRHPTKNNKSACTHQDGVTDPKPLNSGSNTVQESVEDNSGWFANLGDTFQPEIAELRGIAMGALLGIVRDLVVNHTSVTKETPR